MQQSRGYVAFHEDYVYHNNKVVMVARHQNGQELWRNYQFRDRMGNVVFTYKTSPTELGDYDWFLYSPYGHNLDSYTGDNAYPLHQYTGHERDEATGLDYMHARYCNWRYGRFNRPDPGFRYNLSAPYSFNMYTYAQGNPVNAWDPNGEAIETVWDAISFGMGISSFHQNISEGKYLSATLDGVGIGLDGLAMGIPFIPGGAGAAIKAGRKGFQEAAEFAAKRAGDDILNLTSAVWRRNPLERGRLIEKHLAATEYKDWYYVGAEMNGKFPLVDFQKGNVLVSLKTADTTGQTWLKRMKTHIEDLGTRGAMIDGQQAIMRLDLRVQPGGESAANQLIRFGRSQKVIVTVKEF